MEVKFLFLVTLLYLLCCSVNKEQSLFGRGFINHTNYEHLIMDFQPKVIGCVR